MGSPWFPSFGVKAEAENWAGLAWILMGNRSFYIDRGADQAARDKTVEKIGYH